jgi:ABC-type antimicrobial peptide transport system permease subunit
MVYPISNDIDLRVPLPIICIVKQLPGMVSMLSTPLFYKETNFPTDQPFNISTYNHQKYLRYFIPENVSVDIWHNRISGLLDKYQAGIIKDSYVENYRKSFQKGNIIHFEIDTNSQKKGIHADVLDQFIQKSMDPKANPLTRIYDYQFGRFDKDEIGQDYLSVYFTSLDSITQFQQFVQKQLDLKIEMSQINARENYNFVSKLTLITSLFLIIFSIISVSMFLSNLIKSHFERIKKNIGTFKAFGLDNKHLVITYSVISFIFVISAATTAYLLANLLGSIGALKILLSGMGLNLEKGYLYFNLLTQKSLFTFLIIIVLSTLIVFIRLIRMLKHTPGDLIYER